LEQLRGGGAGSEWGAETGDLKQVRKGLGKEGNAREAVVFFAGIGRLSGRKQERVKTNNPKSGIPIVASKTNGKK